MAGVLSSTAPTPEESYGMAEEASQRPVDASDELDLPEVAQTDPERWERLLALLPPLEADALALYCSGDPPRTQSEVAIIQGVSQAAVGYRIARAAQRLRWIAGPGSWFTPDDVRRVLGGTWIPERSIRLLAEFWACGNYAEAGRRVGDPDPRDRTLRLIDRDLAELARIDPDRYGRIHEGFCRLVAEGLALGMRTPGRFDGRLDADAPTGLLGAPRSPVDASAEGGRVSTVWTPRQG
jgi:hypothetical protein